MLEAHVAKPVMLSLTWVSMTACGPTTANILFPEDDRVLLEAPDSFSWRVDVLDFGEDASIPLDINNGGDILGIRVPESKLFHPFVLTDGGLRVRADLIDSSPLRLNDARQVVGAAALGETDEHTAYRWSVDADVLEWLTPGEPSQAVDINADGTVLLVHSPNPPRRDGPDRMPPS